MSPRHISTSCRSTLHGSSSRFRGTTSSSVTPYGWLAATSPCTTAATVSIIRPRAPFVGARSRSLAGNSELGQTLADKHLAPPATTRFLRPAKPTTTDMLRLHARACRFAQTRPDIMAHREVSRSVEHELTPALVSMRAAADGQDRSVGDQHRADIMVRFADVVATQPHRQRLSTLCKSIGLRQTTLRMCCRTFLPAVHRSTCAFAASTRSARLFRRPVTRTSKSRVSRGVTASRSWAALRAPTAPCSGKHRRILCFVPLSNLHSRPGACWRNL